MIEYKNLVIFFNFKPEQQHSLERQVGMHYTFLTSASAPPLAFFSVRHGSLSQFSRSVLKVSSFGLTLTQDEEEWRSGTGSYEKLELRCLAQFGRPQPGITWYINRDQKNDLNGESIFTVREQNGNSHDPNGYIRDWQSDIDFEVSTDLLNYLGNTHGINVNPENGQFSFDLTCHATQVGKQILCISTEGCIIIIFTSLIRYIFRVMGVNIMRKISQRG